MLAMASIASAFIISSCGSLPKPQTIIAKFEFVAPYASKEYSNLDKPINVRVINSAGANGYEDRSAIPSAVQKFMPAISFLNTPEEPFKETTMSYMSNLGFDIKPAADYTLIFDIKKCMAIYSWDNTGKGLTKKGTSEAEWVLSFSYRLVNEAGETIMTGSTLTEKNKDLQDDYKQAIKKVDWNRIADNLGVAKTAKQEMNAQVTGAGDTALEHTVIRWFINSRPAGADVYWRVVSSTPDVSNTNASYIGNTPYESTESFDLKGLTYNNSGNVQIEVTCERPGYLPQKKRFNLRQVIDQKEISAMFNLVKDE